MIELIGFVPDHMTYFMNTCHYHYSIELSTDHFPSIASLLWTLTSRNCYLKRPSYGGYKTSRQLNYPAWYKNGPATT